MAKLNFHGRHAFRLENEYLRVTVLEQGGHIAEVFHKHAQVSPLWIPHWNSIEPSDFRAEHRMIFGDGPDAKLLAGIMGHNLCLDIFGAPSIEEAAAGYTVHGEASILHYQIAEVRDGLTLELLLPLAQISFTRHLQLLGETIRVRESIKNLVSFDRPIAWTQHVTLAPPFLNPATTEFAASVGRSFVAEDDPGSHAYLAHGTTFKWPNAPGKNGLFCDLRKMHPSAPASGYTAHLVDAKNEHAFFTAFSPEFRLAFSYLWKTADYPWLGIWEENCSRQSSPWNGRTVTRGMEFGVSPIPETRREMVERRQLLDSPTFQWLPANGFRDAEYWIRSQMADQLPASIDWPSD